MKRISRRDFIKGVAIGVSASTIPSFAKQAKTTKPNIVLIFVDDWAWNGTPIRMDDGMANSRMPVLQMPSLEKLANLSDAAGHDGTPGGHVFGNLDG